MKAKERLLSVVISDQMTEEEKFTIRLLIDQVEIEAKLGFIDDLNILIK